MQKLSWPAVGLVAVLGGIAVALAALTDWAPAEILGVLTVLGGGGLGAAAVGSVAGRVQQLQEETSAQTPILETVAHRVNGELDARIAAAQEEAAEQGAARVIAVLREQGVIR